MDSVRLFVDGAPAGSAAAPAGVPANTFAVLIGIDQSGGNHFTGMLAGIRIWNTARSQAQIQAAMDSALAGTETGLVGYWRFNQTSGTTATDLTANQNNGTLVNFVFGTTDGWTAYLPGSGTDAAPFLVCDYASLELIGSSGYPLGSAYALTADIDASASETENSGAGFVPIGTGTTFFSGKFHGRGHVIKSLFINRPTASYTGLFGDVSGTVDSTGISGGSVSGEDYVGGIAGYNNTSGTINNCYNTGSMSGSDLVGSIVGQNDGTITNCHATGSASGSAGGGVVGASSGTITFCYSTGSVSGSFEVGDIVGENENGGTISNCYGAGSVSGKSYVGGIVGENDNGGTISACYSTGSVSGKSLVGGNVGQNAGTISNCYCTGTVSDSSTGGGFAGENISQISNSYSTGSVSGISSVGGFVGANSIYGTTSNCYATGSVSGSSIAGGIAGQNAGTISNCYWDSKATGQTAGYGSNSGTLSGTGLPTAQMKESSNFSGWDFGAVWTIRADSTYPALRGMNNAPFAFADSSTTVTGTIALSPLLLNDYDMETIQQYLVLKVKSISSGATDSVHTLTFLTAAFDTVKYRVGEIRASTGDTLWGNVATAIVALLLSTPNLVSPADLAVDVPTNSALTWNKVVGATSYRAQVASDSLFVFKTDTVITDTSFTSSTLADGTKYFWRVYAEDVGGTSAWSSVFRFTTAAATAIKRIAAPKAFSFSIANGAGLIKYALPKSVHVSLQLYNVKGQMVAEMVGRQQQAGEYAVSLQKGPGAEGAYLVVFKAGEYKRTRMVQLVK